MGTLAHPSFELSEIIEAMTTMRIPCEPVGEGSSKRYRFMSLRQQEPGGIYYVSGTLFSSVTFESSLILCDDERDWGPGNLSIRTLNPQLAYYKLMRFLVGREARAGIHPTAVVSDEAEVSPDAYVGPYCVLERCRIGPGVDLHSFVVVMDGAEIEADVSIEPHSTIGATGVAWAWDDEAAGRVIQPQLGFTRIGAGSFLGSDVSVVRGSVNETTDIGAGCVIAHGSKIGHGARLGAECHFANNVAIGGNVTLGDRCFLGSGAVVRVRVALAAETLVGAGAVVVKDVDEPSQVLVGVPARAVDRATLRMTGVPKVPRRGRQKK